MGIKDNTAIYHPDKLPGAADLAETLAQFPLKECLLPPRSRLPDVRENMFKAWFIRMFV